MKWSGNKLMFSVGSTFIGCKYIWWILVIPPCKVCFRNTKSPRYSTLKSNCSIQPMLNFTKGVKSGTWGGDGELEREPASGESLSEISSSTTAPGRSTLAGPEIQKSEKGPLSESSCSWKGRTCPWIIDTGTSHGLRVLPSIFLHLFSSRTFQPICFILDSLKV